MALNRADIEAAIAKQGTPIGKGDVVLLHPGWLASLADTASKRISRDSRAWARTARDLENMSVGPLAVDDGHAFLFVLGQPKFAGAAR